MLPVALPAGAAPGPDGDPVLTLLGVLLVTVGLPFLVVATTGPLLQRWFSATDHPRKGDPYFLYAAGNAGSLLALLGYPLIVEPSLSLQAQGRLWSAGYVTFAMLVTVCAVQLHRHRNRAPAVGVVDERPTMPDPAVTWHCFGWCPSRCTC